MEIWLDTVDTHVVEQAKSVGLIHGITTNPLLLRSTPKPLSRIGELLTLQSGPLAIQVSLPRADEMVEQGRKLAALSKRVIVKVPATGEGIKAIHALSQMGVATMATALYSPLQAVEAFKAGAHYGALYIGRMQKLGLDPYEVFQLILSYNRTYGTHWKLLAASLQGLEDVFRCLELGVHAVTLKESLYGAFTQPSPHTEKDAEEFNRALDSGWI